MSSPPPPVQQAVKISGPGTLTLTPRSPVPALSPDKVLVRVHYVALNHQDWKAADLSPTVGATAGCDFSGTIHSIGPTVKNRSLQVGDIVCGFVFGNNPDPEERDNGAFGEYVAVLGDLVWRVPENMGLQEASTIGVGLYTVGLGLVHCLGLPLPKPKSPADKIGDVEKAKEKEFVLVYGGGTATGMLAIQILQLAGLTPITTCSPRSASSALAHGAAQTFDYTSPTCASDVRTYTSSTLYYALDCISDASSMALCYAALGTKGGRYCALEPYPLRRHTRRDVKHSWIFLFTVLGKAVEWKGPFQKAAQPEDRAFAERWCVVAQGMLDRGELRGHRWEESELGLRGVVWGVDELRKGRNAGAKLVYRVLGRTGEVKGT